MQNEYQLNETEKELCAQISADLAEVQARAQAVLTTIVRVRKLDGNWTLSGDKLVKA